MARPAGEDRPSQPQAARTALFLEEVYHYQSHIVIRMPAGGISVSLQPRLSLAR